MMFETIDAVKRDDPAREDWCVDGRELNVWVDSSSLTTGVVLERRGTVLEDACWLQPENDAQHKFRRTGHHAERHNLARQRHMKTDSVCVPVSIGHYNREGAR